jgi:pimeloyl-ACP methyl ester carboxylesterase
VVQATPVLLAGNMCDARLWTLDTRAVLPGAVDADLTQDDTIAAMAERALAAAEGPLLPVGFSMGGIVALAMAERAPERMAGLVLLDTNASADLPERAAARPRQQADVRAGALERVVVEELKPNYLAAANRADAALLARLRDMALALGPDVFVRQSEALRTRPDLRQVLPSLDAPVLLMCGEEDRLCPPEWHQALAADARAATLHVVPRAGHMLPLEQPAALAAALSSWRKDLT